MGSVSTILNTPQHLQSINNGLQQIATAETEVMLAKQAGLDVSSAEQQLANNKARLLALKRTYFPNQ